MMGSEPPAQSTALIAEEPGFGQAAHVVVALVEHDEGGLIALALGELCHYQALERIDEASTEGEGFHLAVFV